MEKKKLLLVAISVGVFLALTIGAAILFFAPKDASAYSMASGKNVQAVDTGINVPLPSSAASGSAVRQDSSPQPSSVDPVDLVRQPKEVPGLQQSPEGTNRQGDGFYIGGSATNRSTQTVINVPKPTTAAVPDAAPAGKAVSTTAQTAPKPAVSATSSTSASSTASKPAAVAAPASTAASKPATTTVPAVAAAPQTQAKPASTQTKIYNDYWVQTGAFSTVAKAEGVKATLSSKGITSIIENREVEGKNVFRVRVGPYTSQNEANYWLSLIKSINGFEDSQVRQSESRR
jgi:DedD protein